MADERGGNGNGTLVGCGDSTFRPGWWRQVGSGRMLRWGGTAFTAAHAAVPGREPMDAVRFDALTRSLVGHPSRRALLAIGLAGLLGLGAPSVEAARCGKNKPCPACQRCRRHRCRPDARQDGAACAADDNACTRDVCAGGVCTHPNEPAGTACPDDGDPCTKDECDGNGACTHPPKAEGAPCDTDKTCQGGVCSPCT